VRSVDDRRTLLSRGGRRYGTETYDFLVVGSGLGLEVANVTASQGQSVVVEKGPLGGTCLDRGCIPSKHLLCYADVLETTEGSEAFDVEGVASVNDYGGHPSIRALVDDEIITF